MAMVAKSELFLRQFNGLPPEKTLHMWSDETVGGVVFGVFPRPYFVFDFGQERFVAADRETSSEKMKETESAPKLSVDEDIRSAAAQKPRVPMRHKAPRVTGTYEVETAEQIFVLGSATQTLLHGLEIIERMAPGTLEKLSLMKKRSKRPVALKREDLYEMTSQMKYSEKLENGYWVATNNKGIEALGVVRVAAKLANLSKMQFSVRVVS